MMLAAQLPATITQRKPLSFFTFAPWAKLSETAVFPDLPGIQGREAPTESKRQAACARIRELRGSLTIYTDGSASEGTLEDGASAIFTDGDSEELRDLRTIKRRGKAHTCSYEDELTAMCLAVEWRATECVSGDVVVICTDSQSLCRALTGSNPNPSPLGAMQSQTCGAMDSRPLGNPW